MIRRKTGEKLNRIKGNKIKNKNDVDMMRLQLRLGGLDAYWEMRDSRNNDGLLKVRVRKDHRALICMLKNFLFK